MGDTVKVKTLENVLRLQKNDKGDSVQVIIPPGKVISVSEKEGLELVKVKAGEFLSSGRQKEALKEVKHSGFSVPKGQHERYYKAASSG